MNTTQRILPASQTVIRTLAITTSMVGVATASTLTSTDSRTSVQPQQSQYNIVIDRDFESRAFARRYEKWVDPEYRQAYMEASIEEGLAWQIKANRKARGLTQDDLAALLDTRQSAISRLEDPEYGSHNIETLLKLANAFDCALSVRFISYARLALESSDLSESALVAESFRSNEEKLIGVQNERIKV